LPGGSVPNGPVDPEHVVAIKKMLHDLQPEILSVSFSSMSRQRFLDCFVLETFGSLHREEGFHEMTALSL
jgi:hypothetical protein